MIKEMDSICSPEDVILHINRKHLNNLVEADNGVLKQLFRPKRGFRSLTSAKTTLRGIETVRAIRKGHFANNPTDVRTEMAFLSNLSPKAT
ncbi:DDE-type integrase/transposase/recombinase [Ruegeria sp.]|uniref:DDE-type integrase/transposase/recombinase n=1 Tax=Ruegeria sp. TaxID=1879320 RepID=UPI003C7E092C